MVDNQYKGFNAWFKLMWQNGYIQIFILAIVFFIAILFQLDGTIGIALMLLIPLAVMVTIAYKGFYQYWRDVQQGTNR